MTTRLSKICSSTSALLAMTVAFAASPVNAQPIELDPNVNRLVQISTEIASEFFPEAGFLMAPFMGVLFADAESDKFEPLRKELMAYVDNKVITLERTAVEERVQKYASHIKELNTWRAATPPAPDKVLNSLVSLETLLNDEAHFFMVNDKVEDKDRASLRIIHLAGVTGLHLNTLAELRKLDSGQSNTYYRMWHEWRRKYKAELHLAAGKAVEERVAKITPVTSYSVREQTGVEERCPDKGCNYYKTYSSVTYYRFRDGLSNTVLGKSRNDTLVWQQYSAHIAELRRTSTKYYADVIKTTLNTPQIWEMMAVAQYLSHRYSDRDDAESVLKFSNRLIALGRNAASDFYSRARAYEKLGKPEKAIADYKKALAIDPDFPSAREKLVGMYIKQGSLSWAVGQNREAIEYWALAKTANPAAAEPKWLDKARRDVEPERQ